LLQLRCVESNPNLRVFKALGSARTPHGADARYYLTFQKLAASNAIFTEIREVLFGVPEVLRWQRLRAIRTRQVDFFFVANENLR
jgi:hypothetical protein